MYFTSLKIGLGYIDLLIGFILSIIVLWIYNYYNDLSIFPLLYIPIVYVLLFVFCLRIERHISTPVFLVVNALYFLRYFAFPLSVIIFMPSYYLLRNEEGTLLLLYEEFFVFAAFLLLVKKRKMPTFYKLDTINLKREIRYIRYSLVLLLVICLFLFLINPLWFNSYHFIDNIGNEMVESVLSEKESLQASHSFLDTLAFMIIYVTYLLIPAYFAIVLFLRYKRKPSYFIFLLALFIPIFCSMMFIIDTDRGGIILRAAATMFLVMRLFPGKKKHIMRLTYFPAFLLVLYLILSRSFDSDVTKMEPEVLMVEYMQSYLANIKNCTDALLSYSQYGDLVNYMTPINDILGNVPILSHFSDSSNSCATYLANTLNRSDQVLPLVGNGLFYFGYPLSPILIFLTVGLLLKIDELYLKESNPLGIYVYSYAAVQIAFCHYQNVQLIFLYLTCMIAPIWLLYKLVKFVSK